MNKIDAFFVGFAILLTWTCFIFIAPFKWSMTICWLVGALTIGSLIARFSLSLAYGSKNQLIKAQQNVMDKMLDHMKTLTTICNHQQAKIDSLMLEFCPDEMTPMQLANWAAHQQAVDPELQKKINDALH